MPRTIKPPAIFINGVRVFAVELRAVDAYAEYTVVSIAADGSVVEHADLIQGQTVLTLDGRRGTLTYPLPDVINRDEEAQNLLAAILAAEGLTPGVDQVLTA